MVDGNERSFADIPVQELRESARAKVQENAEKMKRRNEDSAVIDPLAPGELVAIKRTPNELQSSLTPIWTDSNRPFKVLSV